jgi:hypothetical protein
VTLARLYHRFEHLRGNQLSADDLVYDDYFASHHPINATKFHIVRGQKGFQTGDAANKVFS